MFMCFTIDVRDAIEIRLLHQSLRFVVCAFRILLFSCNFHRLILKIFVIPTCRMACSRQRREARNYSIGNLRKCCRYYHDFYRQGLSLVYLSCMWSILLTLSRIIIEVSFLLLPQVPQSCQRILYPLQSSNKLASRFGAYRVRSET